MKNSILYESSKTAHHLDKNGVSMKKYEKNLDLE